MPLRIHSPRLLAMSLATHFGIGVHMSFFPIFLAGREFSAATIGTLLAIPPLVRIVSSPLVTGLADRHVAPAVILMVSHGVFGAAYLAMHWADGFLALALLVGIGGIVHAALVPLSDVLLTREIARDRRIDYGVIRAWGSVSFMTATLAGGLVATRFGSEAIVLAIAAAGITAALVMSIQPRTADPQAQAGAAAGAASSQPLLVLALVFAGIGCVHASHAGVYSFGSLHWRALGYSPDAIGVLWAIALLAEIALFFVFGALPRRLPLALALLAAGAVVAALRWALITVDLGPAGMALVQVLHAGSFGLAHLGGLAALNLLARPGTRSRAQGIVSSSVAIGVSAATYLCGRLFEVTGERAFAAMVPVALAGLVAFALAWRVSRR